MYWKTMRWFVFETRPVSPAKSWNNLSKYIHYLKNFGQKSAETVRVHMYFIICFICIFVTPGESLIFFCSVICTIILTASEIFAFQMCSASLWHDELPVFVWHFVSVVIIGDVRHRFHISWHVSIRVFPIIADQDHAPPLLWCPIVTGPA